MNREEKRAYHREYSREHYKNHKKEKSVCMKKRGLEIRAWFNDYKATISCSRCPESTSVCLDFHHSKDDKEVGVAHLVTSSASKKRILAEIKKCIVLCSNCHRKEHKRLKDE